MTDKQPLDFWNYGSHPLPGWVQGGDIHGFKFGCWTRQEADGTTLSIMLGDGGTRYWLRIGNCYHGSHKSPEAAAKHAERVKATSP